MRKSPRFSKIAAALLIAFSVTVGVVAVVIAGGNDFVYGELRVDLPEIYNARYYRTTIKALESPTINGDFSSGWLGVNLAQQTQEEGSGKFSQVGLLTKESNVRWFVYAEPRVTCLRGSPAWGSRGCEGDPGDLVALQTWYRVEILTEGNGYWTARLYDVNSIPHDLARIWHTSTRIYRAGVVSEEAYTSEQDPYFTVKFAHYRPQYFSVAGYQDWPVSDGNNSVIKSIDNNLQNTFCPQHYGAEMNLLGDERLWHAGTGGHVCRWLLFPAHHSYLPAVKLMPTPTTCGFDGC